MEVAFPVQNLAIGRYELVVAQSGSRDDDAIGRIVGVGKTTLYPYLTPDGQRRGERPPDGAR